jgi:hypothetical protein
MMYRTADGVERPQGAAVIDIKQGDLIWLGRTDRDRDKVGTLPGADAPWSVLATPEP